MNQSEPDISVGGNSDWESTGIAKGDKAHWGSVSEIGRFSHDAMATTFEIFIQHDDAHYAQQAARAAFEELDKLEAELSRFIENSDISRINNLADGRPLRIGPAAFECLRLCTDMYAETGGAFDITIGALMDCWFDKDKKMRCPTEDELKLARQCTGLHLITLDKEEYTVTKHKSGPSGSAKIDLGGIGKGYAVDQMARLLGDWSIDTALIHGGFSSVLALGAPSEAEGWPVTLSNPSNRSRTLARLYLRNRAVGGSGLQRGRHIIDPRTAQPVRGKIAAWACAGSAAAADVLSTAFMVMSPDEVEQYCLKHSDTLAMLVTNEGDTEASGNVLHFGPWKEGELHK